MGCLSTCHVTWYNNFMIAFLMQPTHNQKENLSLALTLLRKSSLNPSFVTASELAGRASFDPGVGFSLQCAASLSPRSVGRIQEQNIEKKNRFIATES